MAVWCVYYPVTNTDIWWHLAAGREICHNLAIPRYDIFSYTNHQAEWIDLHWLFQLCSYVIFTTTGIGGILGAKLFFIFITGVIIVYTIKNPRIAVLAAFLWMISMFAFKYLMLARPSLITLFMLAIYILLIEKYRFTKKSQWLLALIPLQIIWTNMQGLFILGHAILVMFIIDQFYCRITNHYDKNQQTKRLKTFFQKEKKLLGVAILHFGSSLVNPYGINGMLFPFKLFMRINPFYENIFSERISENTPVFNLPAKEISYLYAFIAFVLILALSFFLKQGGIRVFHILLAFSFAFLALIAKRNLALFSVIFSFLTAYNFARIKPYYRTIVNTKPIKAFLGILLIVVLFFQSAILVKSAQAYPEDSLISPFRVPVYASKYMKANPKSGKIFTSMRYGGYLIFTLYPDKKVNIDGRMIIRDAEFYKHYLKLVTIPDKYFPEYAEKHQIQRVLLPLSMIELYNPLRKWLYNSDSWRIELIDGESVLFEKKPNLHKGYFETVTKNEVLKIIAARFDNNKIIRKEAVNNYIRFFNLVQF
jgi:hypothetical protein